MASIIKPFWWFNDEQKELIKDSNQFADDHIHLSEKAYWEKRFPWEVMDMVAEKGYMGAGVPKKYGGLGLGATGSCIVAEALGRLYAVGHVFVVSMLGGLHQFLKFGTEEMKQKYLTQIADGNVLGAVCITEPFAGSDAANVYTTAEKDGDEWIINGKKRMVTAVGAAGRYFVYTKTSDDPQKRKYYQHLTAFVIDKGTPGFTLEKINDLIGFDNVPNGYLDFDNVRIPDSQRCGGVGQGWQVMMAGLNFERLIGAAVVGGGFGDIIRMLTHYMERRVQFRTQVNRFTNLQFDLADIITKFRIARLVNYHVAYLLDHGSEMNISEMSLGVWSSIAKLYSTISAQEIGIKAVQMSGGDGLTKFYPIERLVREAKIGEIVAGTTEVQKMIIYRGILQEPGFNDIDHRFKLHPELDVPIITSEESPWLDKELTEETFLKILADDYKMNPGLYMTDQDLRDLTNWKRSGIREMAEKLEEEGLVVTYRDRKGKVKMVKATYKGLDKANPKEYYRWFPPWAKEDERLMEMTKF
ncbi:MAG: acyl-CoA dehydrogenase [Candidatus Lokiarchaeota archaeon]|nr:acyl-CoA dehydrogenase [Candidatus Lokiarchaeota archaeon]